MGGDDDGDDGGGLAGTVLRLAWRSGGSPETDRGGAVAARYIIDCSHTSPIRRPILLYRSISTTDSILFFPSFTFRLYSRVAGELHF